MERLRGVRGRSGGDRWRLALLAICFLLGVAVGQVLASGMPPEAAEELRLCLRDRLARERTGRDRIVGEGGSLSEAVLFLRGPLLAALCGCTSAGGLLLCVLAAGGGFLLAFSVGCFTAAFGGAGLLLAAAAMGIRCLVTLPCFFLLAVSLMGAFPARRLSMGGIRPRRTGAGGKSLPLRLTACFAVLCLGLCADLYLTPRLLRWAVTRVLL